MAPRPFLNRLRSTVHSWGEAGTVDEEFQAQFESQINDDLNMPRALAVVWELVRSDLSPATKKATILQFDRVLGLGLAQWQPEETVVPQAIFALAEQRQQARQEKRWQEADALRDQTRPPAVIGR
ncbi:MAG: DALR domain-containing protein [Caldilineaceae bacterium]